MYHIPEVGKCVVLQLLHYSNVFCRLAFVMMKDSLVSCFLRYRRARVINEFIRLPSDDSVASSNDCPVRVLDVRRRFLLRRFPLCFVDVSFRRTRA